MSKSNPSTNKVKSVTIRLDLHTVKLLDWYLESRGGTKTNALLDMIQIGGTVLIQREYKEE